MQTYSLRRSSIDSEFLEIVLNGVVIQEVKVSYALRNLSLSFGSLEEIFGWLEKTEEKLAKTAAYRLLARRSFSKEVLFRKLREKKFSEERCRKVVEDIEKLGLLSDIDFGEMVIARKMKQGYGPQYIERYFRELGLDPSQVRQIIDEETEKELLKKLLFKIRSKERSKKIAFFLRRGFDFRLIQAICT
jgi:SOS response regulatory protein OraA/RecX